MRKNRNGGYIVSLAPETEDGRAEGELLPP